MQEQMPPGQCCQRCREGRGLEGRRQVRARGIEQPSTTRALQRANELSKIRATQLSCSTSGDDIDRKKERVTLGGDGGSTATTTRA